MTSIIQDIGGAWGQNKTMAMQNGYLDRAHGLFSGYLSGWSNLQIAGAILLIIITYDQLRYIQQKGSIAGPKFKIPIMGPFIQALYPKFDAYLEQWASGPLSCVSVFHKFVVLASDRDIAHKVFKSPTYAKPCLVPIATEIMSPNAWVFLAGKAHAEFRRGLTGLFTNKALSTYLPVQERVYADYFDKFVAASEANKGKPMGFMGHFREINCALSCRTFFGGYISQAAIKRIADDFYLVTAALELVNVPLSIYVPFTKPWRGKRTADAVQAEFTKCAAACKANMASGAEPTCIVDQWVLHMMESKQYYERIAAGEVGLEKPTNLIREFTNEEIGQTMFTFLFASQDASSSATTWMFQILAQRPDVLDRLREENLAVRSGDKTRPFELSMYESLTYTNAVIKELLRHRPPVIFVPYLATKDFPVTPDYTVPKGAMIVPSCYPALHDPEAYPNPDVFDPDRWITGDAQSKTKNWLVFGTGAHDCLARSYVPLTMAAMIGKAALEIDWVHHATPRSEEIRVFATLFPMDECQLVFSKRKTVERALRFSRNHSPSEPQCQSTKSRDMAASKGTILMTGANGGLGVALVSHITASPELSAYHCIYTVRNVDAAAALKSALANAPTSHSHEIVALDMAKLSGVRDLASTIAARVAAGEIPPIRAALLTAGYIEYNTQNWTDEGLDLSFVVNYLGNWLLTLMLLQSMDREAGRIVVVNSWTYDPNDTRNGPVPEQWRTVFKDSTSAVAKGSWSNNSQNPSFQSGLRRYGAAKLCLMMMVGELQRRLNSDPVLNNILILSVDPGVFASDISRRSPWPIRFLMYCTTIPLLASITTWLWPNGTVRTQTKGAQDIIHAAFESNGASDERTTNTYLDGTTPREMSTEARDVKKREVLWRESIEYAQLKEGDTVLVNWR
ncbi:uncharacterized protein JN550_005760 [Neoarthrinium moseri]|uniref:uncharacterized protein n=1 Tax=Neoarthrinium moseri TaxID=1658444 RepID=UPI001FDB3C37|nr:uncharacterized protein JN550_005760 [Neoarthrinium moseri]KAI1869779.1 hypothetical protein JN550_005760 [Neoarthrinium moseri]